MTTTDWSLSETDVLSRVGDALADDRDDVLATVIDVEGSAYRRPGAKMLIRPDDTAGSITAGCLEDEVARVGGEVRESGEPRIETYDLTGGDDALWGHGMGCNGIITVLLEPVDERHRPVVETVAAHEPVAVATVVGGAGTVGERAWYRPDEGFAGGLDEQIREALAGPAAELLGDGGADVVEVETDDGPIEVFVDGIDVPSHLVVLGSGPDVVPVVDLAKRVDFRVSVVSFRGARANRERFPGADAVLSSSPAALGDDLSFDDETYVVVMTHNFVDDGLALETLLDTRVPYIGLMGPRERFEELREEFDDEVSMTGEDVERVHTPIGLDLGGDSPYEVAYSIVGEVLAVANGRSSGHLSARAGPIHDRRDLDAGVAPE